MRLIFISIILFVLAPMADAQSIPSSAGTLTVTRMASGLREPWGLAFLPGGGFLVTLRGGTLMNFDAGGAGVAVAGVPRVFSRQQGGLLDVVAARDFALTRTVFLTYAKPNGRRAGTALATATLSADGRRLENLRVIFEMSPQSTSGKHFGSRVVEAPDGTLFLTVGERGDRDEAQNLGSHNGTVVRVTRSGAVPGDNPFGVNGQLTEIWSYGHRNAQGATLDAKGRLWIVEHGAKGGDEINRIRRGRNYGWPVIAYGRHYNGRKIGVGTRQDGMEQPDFYWDPSIAPSGLMIYSGKLWPRWRGHFFVGSLKFDYISRLNPSGGLREVEQLRSGETGRVRDIREAPDGSIWFLSVNDRAVYKITP